MQNKGATYASVKPLSRSSTTRRPTTATKEPKPWNKSIPESRPLSSLLTQFINHRPPSTPSRNNCMAKDKFSASSEYLRNPNPMKMADVKRWDPQTRSTSRWDGLRQDPELFHQQGDCLVHLHAKGHSRRPPSFKLPLRRIYQMRCNSIFGLCRAEETEESRAIRSAGHRRVFQLFVPAPLNSIREDAFTWHVTTRNFFAFLFNKPLVGSHLGRAMTDLRERLQLFRVDGVDNDRDMYTYLDKAGYLNFSHNADYALAVLQYAERYQLHDLFIDSFVHVVGMNHVLVSSPEYEAVARTTKILITRASLEMSVHLARVSASLSNFLEVELSASNVGLGAGARSHLDLFRTFLHQYHVEKFGYWPPLEGSNFPKALYKSMYFDFRALYDYLADQESAESTLSERLPDGGICVLQNISAFNHKHGFAPLPHALPLLPNATTTFTKTHSRRLKKLGKLGSTRESIGRQFSARSALCAAANVRDASVSDTPLVKAYRVFERESTQRKDDKVSLQDSRKVRWMLIYAVLQVLISAMQAPSEVRDTDGPGYPLCVKVAGMLPWEATFGEQLKSTPLHRTSRRRPGTSRGSRPETAHSTTDVNGMPIPELGAASPTTPGLDIQPDCETDASYMSRSRNTSARDIVALPDVADLLTAAPASITTAPPPLAEAEFVRRNSSRRSLKALSMITFASRRQSSVVKTQPMAHCEILVHGYGNGLNAANNGKDARAVSSDSIAELPASIVPRIRQRPDVELPAAAAVRPRTYHAELSSSSSMFGRPPSVPTRRSSMKLPKSLSCSAIVVAPESVRTPTLHIAQVDTSLKEQLGAHLVRSISIRGSDNFTPLSASTGTDSDDDVSPVWSSRRGSASSQSSKSFVLPLATQADQLPITRAKPMQTGASPQNRQSQPEEPLARYKYSETNLAKDIRPYTAIYECVSAPALRDADSLLTTNAARMAPFHPKGILVQRSFSIEHKSNDKEDKRVSLAVPSAPPFTLEILASATATSATSAAVPPATFASTTATSAAVSKRREQEKKLKERALAGRKHNRRSFVSPIRMIPTVDLTSSVPCGPVRIPVLY